jgi:hypothetical protein
LILGAKLPIKVSLGIIMKKRLAGVESMLVSGSKKMVKEYPKVTVLFIYKMVGFTKVSSKTIVIMAEDALNKKMAAFIGATGKMVRQMVKVSSLIHTNKLFMMVIG